MTEQEVFVLADRALNDVVSKIANGQWDMAPTLREIINYHGYDDSWVPDMLAGKTMDEAGPGLQSCTGHQGSGLYGP